MAWAELINYSHVVSHMERSVLFQVSKVGSRRAFSPSAVSCDDKTYVSCKGNMVQVVGYEDDTKLTHKLVRNVGPRWARVSIVVGGCHEVP